MPRAKKDVPIDLTRTHDLSVGLIERLACPTDKEQVFLRAASVEGLRVRCTVKGAKSWVYESKVQGKTFRRTLGPVGVLSIPDAEDKARALALVVKTDKADPRELDRQQAEAEAAAQAEAQARAAEQAAEDARRTTASRVAWDAYITERSPRWSESHRIDHKELAQEAQDAPPRKAGPLAELLRLPLSGITAEVVRRWVKREAPNRAARVRLSLRLLKAFLRWCETEPTFRGLAAPDAIGRRAVDAAGAPKRGGLALMREQLPAWFASVRQLPPVPAAMLQCLLLLGCRHNEMARLRWENVDFTWGRLHLNDKNDTVSGRDVPLSAFIASLLSALPRTGALVFQSPRVLSMTPQNIRRRERRDSAKPQNENSVVAVNELHTQACLRAGLPPLTLHDLRRSNASLAEWVNVPPGVAAQISGHKPSGVRERHYIVRPFDMLKIHGEVIERFIVESAGLKWPDSKPQRLHAVT